MKRVLHVLDASTDLQDLSTSTTFIITTTVHHYALLNAWSVFLAADSTAWEYCSPWSPVDASCIPMHCWWMLFVS